MSARLPDPAFWSGRRVLLTGHTGFKGSWLLEWLQEMGAEVTGLALESEGPAALYSSLHGETHLGAEIADLRDQARVADIVIRARPEIVFHLAAQSLVRRGYADPIGTFAINIDGTRNVLEALRRAGSARAIVVTTTDKVYRNDGRPRAFTETDPLGGDDPYSRSKAICELVVAGYRAHFEQAGCGIATARAGNVIGGGDWAEDRLIPDAMRAWGRGEKLFVRRPDATRPWQHVLEPLRGYLVLAERLAAGEALAPAYNFGPAEAPASVRAVLERAASRFEAPRTEFAQRIEGPHEAATLALDPRLAARDLGVAPVWSLDETVRRTADWYRGFFAGADPRHLVAADRAAFLASAGRAPHETRTEKVA